MTTEAPAAAAVPAAISEKDRQEFDRTYGSKLWRMENLYKIRDKDRNLRLLKLNRIQRAMLKLVDGMKPIKAFFLKYRQGGVSTFWLIWHLDDTIFHPNTVTGILADKKENLNVLFEIVRIAHENMPAEVRPLLGDDSKSALSFPEIGSKIMVSLSIKSTALHNLHISEWAYCKEEEIRRTLGACGPRANVTGETTGNGVGNDAYTKYQEIKEGTSEYRGKFYPWFIQPEYRLPLNGMDGAAVLRSLDREEQRLARLMKTEYELVLDAEQVLFRRMKKRELKSLFRQEFPETDEDAFLTSGSKFFNALKINVLMLEAREYLQKNPPILETEDLIQFEKPAKRDIYAAGADTAEGGGDYSVLKILNVTRRREAFRYRARVGVDRFYKVCNQFGRLYNNALLGVERNNHGHAVILGLDEGCRYPNLWKEAVTQKTGAKAVGRDIQKFKIGWQTNPISRPLMLDMLKVGIEGDSEEDENHFQPEYTVLDLQFLRECLTFEDVEGKFQAVAGEFDDNVFGTGIAFQMYLKCRRTVAREGAGGLSDRIQVGTAREAARS